jgi:Fe-S cluster biosynthesis and repair protein YggX
MSQLHERIAQFQKMAHDDPDNDLGHYRLGQLLLEDKQYAEAVRSFRRTLELNPQFSKVYQLLALALLHDNQKAEAIEVLRQGFAAADERGDNLPRDEMARMLVELGEPAPQSRRGAGASSKEIGEGGFRCQRPGCVSGGRGHQLARQPFSDELGKRIQETVCAECWEDWRRNYSIKVINELRLDLSTERGAEEYDRYMREFLGMD